MESFEKLLKQEIFERFYKLSSKQGKEINISGKYHEKESLTVFRCFPKKQNIF